MKISYLAVLVFLFVSCGENAKKQETSDVIANTSCVLNIEGMMCERGCKTTIESRLAETKGVVLCEVEYEQKKVSLDFDGNYISTEELMTIVNDIAGGIYRATLLEENVFIPAQGAENIKGGGETDEVSVSEYNYQLPDFSSMFSNFI